MSKKSLKKVQIEKFPCILYIEGKNINLEIIFTTKFKYKTLRYSFSQNIQKFLIDKFVTNISYL